MTNIDLAIKFGSNEIIIFRKGYGIVSKCSAFIAVTEKGKNFKVKDIGKQAEKMLKANAEGVKVYEPIKNSEIVDTKLAVALISELLNSIILDKFLLGRIKALVAIP
ncbi:MAG: rod shape-determining protein, partial [Clostridia bacterium]|nr:rod shape-determining protein [Clostridia bacterium]